MLGMEEPTVRDSDATWHMLNSDLRRTVELLDGFYLRLECTRMLR